MPEGAERFSHQVPPRLIVSKPAEGANISQTNTESRRRRSSGSSVYQKDQTSSEWTDIDDPPPRRRRKKSRRVPSSNSSTSSISSRSHTRQQFNKGSPIGFFPSLSRIREGNDSRPSTRGSDRIQRREKKAGGRTRRRDEASTSHRRSLKPTTNSSYIHTEGFPKIDPSLLSALSTMTGNSDKSSNSSSTVTPQSYHRRNSDRSEASSKQQRLEKEVRSSITAEEPDVFDYMESETVSDDRDDQSVASASSSSSHYQPSDAGSSVAPDTPSSRSTFPSPTSTRFQSVADLRRKYDAPPSCAANSGRSYSNSPVPSLQSLRKQPTVSDVAEDEEEDTVPPMAPSEVDYDFQRPPSRNSRRYSRSSDRSQHREESLRRHSVSSQQGHYVEPVYGQHRSFSNSSAHSDRSAYAYHMAMQQYHWPSPPPMPPQAMNGHISPADRPPVPDAPDLTRRTLTGYEEMALELASTTSPVKPLYRKFEYLNHRILLHLQDELSELEEQLRTLDEIIAQMDPAICDGSKSPASRRGDNFHGCELHHRRTHLLGNIFVKTEQYNRALSAYTAIVKDSVSATDDQVHRYQDWMSNHAPVHEIETQFLQQTQDLIVPGQSISSSVDRSTKHAALAYMPVALMLPLLLFSILPTLAGRLLVTAFIATGAFIVAATTKIRHLMPARDWAVCGAAYVLLMAAIAGCVPQYPTTHELNITRRR